MMPQTTTLARVMRPRPALVVVAKRTRSGAMAPLNRKRPALLRLRAALTRKLAKFLHAQAPKIAAQVARLRARMGKAEASAEEKAAIEAIIAQVDFSGWAVLVGDIDGDIEAVIKESAYAALAQVGIDVEARPEIRNIVDERAIAYARERAADMVGMRVDELGRLVENPNAFWQITDPTRDFIRADVTQAIAEGWSNDRLSTALAEAYGFSGSRATTIARTETNRAASIGALIGYKASGVVEAKQWLTAEDDLVSEECLENGAAGPGGDGVLPLDDDYPSGDEAPPVHPNCRCAIAPVVDFAARESEDGETTGESVVDTVADIATTLDALADVGGTTVEVAADAEAVANATEVAAVERAAPEVKWIGNTSDAFRAEMTGFMDSLPDGVASTLADGDIKFVFGERLTQVMPELKGVHPRGWPSGTTWDSAEGLFRPDKNLAVVAETFRPIGKRGFVAVETKRARGVLAHEMGHGLDKALARASRSADFMAAYKADAKVIRAAMRADAMGGRRWAYYLQRGDAGPSEAFAEMFGQLMTDGPATSFYDMRDAWPNVAKFMRDLIEGLEA